VATRTSRLHRAVPRSMDREQFERILRNAGWLAILTMGIIAFAVAMSLGKFILAPISLAVVIGLMFGPVADIMERRGLPSALSAGVVVILFLGLIGLAGMLFAAPISEWVARGPLLWQRLQAQLVSFQEPLAALGSIQEQLKSVMGGGDASMTVEVEDGGPVQDMALMVPTLLADILLFLAGLYFFLATRHNIRLTVLSLCFSRQMRWRAAHIFHDVETKVSRFLLSATAINLGVGVATGLAMWAIGMPSPLLWGGLAAVLNFIPYIGQAIMLAVLFAVSLGTHTDLVSILLPVVLYAAINFTADQLIFPHLVGKALTLNPFVIFVSIAFWMWLWGPMGGFVAVPSLLVIQSIILHVFPSTVNVPKAVQRRLEARATNDAREAPPVEPPPQPTPAEVEVIAKPKRTRRKTAIPAAS
jgi:predicted PurR-regulated permease PerM